MRKGIFGNRLKDGSSAILFPLASRRSFSIYNEINFHNSHEATSCFELACSRKIMIQAARKGWREDGGISFIFLPPYSVVY